MAEIFYFIFFAVGLLMVVKGSDWFVDSAVWVAAAFRIPPIIIGATIVSICTTLPETFVSAAAALKGESAMAVGNAFGSIAANGGIILGVLFVFAQPYIENRRELIKNSSFLAFLLLLLWVVGFLLGEISKLVGFVLLILLVLYIFNNVVSARKLMDLDIQYDIVDEKDIPHPVHPDASMPEGVVYDESENDFDISSQIIARKIFFFCIGVVFVIFGSNLLVDNGIRIAELLGVPSFMIAVIFTSVGTSLPEMITVITSVRKGVSNLGIGNIIGANILNIVQVIGISALLQPLPMAAEKSILLFQLPLLLILTLLLIGFGLFGKDRLNRWSGIWLLALYFVFLSVNLFRGAVPMIGPMLF